MLDETERRLVPVIRHLRLKVSSYFSLSAKWQLQGAHQRKVVKQELAACAGV